MAFYPNINGFFGSLDNPALKFLPNFWIADSLYWFSAGKPMNALPYIGLLLGTSLIFLIAALFTAKKLYYKTWLESFEIKIKNSRLRKKQIPSRYLTTNLYLHLKQMFYSKRNFCNFSENRDNGLPFSYNFFDSNFYCQSMRN